MKEIIIDKHTKGILVFAKAKDSKWLILISNVRNGEINRHISYDIIDDTFLFDGGEIRCWGNTRGYSFYEPTLEQKQLIINKLKEKGYKFIPILNKLVKKNNSY